MRHSVFNYEPIPIGPCDKCGEQGDGTVGEILNPSASMTLCKKCYREAGFTLAELSTEELQKMWECLVTQRPIGVL